MNFINKFFSGRNGKVAAFLMVAFLGIVALTSIDLGGTSNLPEKNEKAGKVFEQSSEKSEYESFDGESFGKNNTRVNSNPQSPLNTEEIDKSSNPLDGLPTGLEDNSISPAEIALLRNQFLDLENRYQLLLQDKNSDTEEEKKTVKVAAMSIGYTPPKAHKKPLIGSKRFAPYGRYVRCRLAFSIDSSSLGSPITAVTEEDVVHNGLVVIPKGTELSGESNALHLRDRITGEKNWVFVWRNPNSPDNGKELRVKGRALTCDILPAQPGDRITRYGPADGSLGIRGRVIETGEFQELKKDLLTLINGASSGFYEILAAQNTDDSNSLESGDDESRVSEDQQYRGAAAGGLQALTQKKLLDIEAEIKENGRFVRVTGGTQFYLFVDQTIDMAEAKIGGTIFQDSNKGQSSSEEDQLNALTSIMLKRSQLRNK
jgi:hypothetical protein